MFQGQVLAPGVQATAEAVGRQQHRGQAPVSPGKDAFQPGLGGSVPFHLNLMMAQPVLDSVQVILVFLQTQLPLPLEGGVGLGNEAPEADVEPGAAVASPDDLHRQPGGWPPDQQCPPGAVPA